MSFTVRPGRRPPLAVEALEDRLTPIAGFLDPAFGNQGLTQVAFPRQGTFNTSAEGNAVAVQTDGKILMAGWAHPTINGGEDFAVARLNTNGTLDSTFGNGGLVTVPFDLGGVNNNDDEANAVVIQADGRIILGGFCDTAVDGKDWALCRLMPNGTLDTSYGANKTGKINLNFAIFVNNGLDDEIFGMALQQNGDLITVGDSVFNGFCVARWNTDGTIDGSFGKGGQMNQVLAGSSLGQHAAAVAIQSNGQILVAGNANNDMALMRVNTNGTVDGSFAASGFFYAGFANANGFNSGTGAAIALQPNGQILLAGSATKNANQDFAVVRVNPTGTIDGSFGAAGGRITIGFNMQTNFGFTSNADRASGILVDTAGRIYITGTADKSGTGEADFASARLLTNGTLDTSWGNNGTFGPNNPPLIPLGQMVYDIGVQANIFQNQQANATVFFLGGSSILILGSTSTEMVILKVETGGAIPGGGGGGGGGGVSPPPPPGVPPVTPPPGFGGPLATIASGLPDGSAYRLAQNLAITNQLYPIPSIVFPFGQIGADVRTGQADVNGDGTLDTLYITGPGVPCRFMVLDGRNDRPLVDQTDPFGDNFTGGGFIAGGDINGDGRAEIVITPDQGGGPNVVIYGTNADGSLTDPQSFFAFGNPSFRGGARPAVGDINNDGKADLVVAAGFLGGPNVEIHSGAALAVNDFSTLMVPGFFAYDQFDSITLRNGVYVAVGDVNGDGFADIAFGGGPGGGPRVTILDGKTLSTRGLAAAQANPIANFMAGDPADRSGARVALVNLDQDGFKDLMIGSGEGAPSQIQVLLGADLANGVQSAVQVTDPFGQVVPDGVFVG
jgi:uncharacterized delta-60 repeat protein